MARLESLHRTLANGLECGVVVTDREGRVRSANPAVQRILGMPLANILGREVSWLVPLLDTASEMAADRGHVACERRMPDGSTRHLRIGRSLLADPFSNAIGELFVVQDVTRLEELEERLADEEQAGLEIGTGEDDLADQESSSDGPGAEDGLIGDCPAMRDVVRLTEKVSVADATVLITGESGTGKELVARAIHRRSPRSSGPFLAVNCGAIPETLIESELFGHVRGAFTGAITDRPGLFRRAHGGTIFLDEIGELSPALQVRLLRVLQDHMVMPVGGTKSIEVDVRVLAATNRNLEELVRQGVYREDLFYRLAVISIELPPLRERGGDLEHLIGHFVRQAAERHGRPIQGLSARAMRCLLRHAYPGNVRELENVIEHAITLVEGDIVREQDLPDSVRGHASVEPMAEPIVRATAIGMLDDGAPRDDLSSWPSLISESFPPNAASYPAFGAATSAPRILLPIDEGEGASLDDQLARREKEMILAALDRAAGVKKKAARLLGINYRSFRHRLQKYGLERGDSPAPRGFPPDSDY
jgi:PAS domain S-box-containing protein